MLDRIFSLAIASMVFLFASQAISEPSPGNPPAILIASGIDEGGRLLLVEYRTIFIQPAGPLGGGGPRENERSENAVSLEGVKIYDSKGKEMTIAAARKLLVTKDKPVLVTSWGEEISPFFRAAFGNETLHFAFPKQAPVWRPIQSPSTPVRR